MLPMYSPYKLCAGWYAFKSCCLLEQTICVERVCCKSEGIVSRTLNYFQYRRCELPVEGFEYKRSWISFHSQW